MKEIRIDSEGLNDAVTVEDVKAWGKISGTADDTLIDNLIRSCRGLQETWTGRSYIGKSLTVQWDKAPDGILELPYGPIRSITSIKRVYEDGSLSDALVAATDYYISGMDFQVVNLYNRWTSSGLITTGIRAAYTAGHGSASGQVPLPEALRSALLRHVLTDYEMRDDLEVSQPALYDWVKEILAPYRITNLWL